MNFSCDKCQRRYSIADEKVRGKTVKVRCKNCQNVISVQGPPLEMEESTRVVSLADVERIREQERLVAATASQPAAPALGDGQWDEEPTRAAPMRPQAAAWFVMVKSKQEGPLDEAGLRGLLDSGAVNGRSFFWQQGMADWKRGVDIPELSGLFAAPPPPAPAPPPAPSLPPEPATVNTRGAQQRAAPRQEQPWEEQPAAGREPWDLDPPAAEQPQQAQEPWEDQPATGQQPAWDEQEPQQEQQPAWSDEPEQQPAASAQGGQPAMGDLFSDLDLPDKSAPDTEEEPPTAIVSGTAEPDPLAAVAGTGKSGKSKQPVEDTRHFMVKSGVTRRNPAWKVALFILVPIGLIVGGVFAADRLNFVPKVKVVNAKGETVEKSLFFSGEGVSELRDRLMGRNKPVAPAPTPAPAPPPAEKKPQGAQKPGAGEPPANPETGQSAEELKALYGNADKQDVGPEVRKDAEVAAKDAAGSGGPPQEDVLRVVANSQGAIQGCVEQELRKNPKFKGGKVVLTATVGTSGTVKKATLDRKELDSSPVGDCIKKSARKMVFPAFNADDGTEEVDLEIPLVLSAGAM